jgi:uncharacterized protein (DUF342 family)
MDYNRKLGRIQPEAYRQDYDTAYAEGPIESRISTRSLIACQESTFNLLQELQETISMLENRLHHVCAPAEVEPKTNHTDQLASSSSSSGAVSMATEINNRLQMATYRIKTIIERVEL